LIRWCYEQAEIQAIADEPIRARRRYCEQLEPLEAEIGQRTQDVGVFWDFLSLPQSKGGGRTPLETRAVKLALANMQLLYGHTHAAVLKMIKMPLPPARLDKRRRFTVVVDGKPKTLAWEYHDRGWPFFESAVANINLAVRASRLEFGMNFEAGFMTTSKGEVALSQRSIASLGLWVTH